MLLTTPIKSFLAEELHLQTKQIYLQLDLNLMKKYGNLKIERDEELIDETALIDFVIAEVKTGIKKE